jgi:hypothetical protein
MPEDEFKVVDDAPGEPGEHTDPPPDPPRDELDQNRVRQLLVLRRSAYRRRSYAIIAMVACAVAAGQLAWMTIDYLRVIGVAIRPVLYLAGLILAVVGTLYFARQAMTLHRETTQEFLSDPEKPPDFSTLSDGTERWRRLEEIE